MGIIFDGGKAGHRSLGVRPIPPPAPSAKAWARPALPDGVALRLGIIREKMFRGSQQAIAGTGVTPNMHAMLVMIGDNPGIRQGALAEALMMQPPNVAAMIAELERAGWISRTPDPGDMRVFAMALTRSGARLLADLQRRLDAFEQDFLGALDLSERQELHRFLTRILAPGGSPATRRR